jgi:hypothetical protein
VTLFLEERHTFRKARERLRRARERLRKAESATKAQRPTHRGARFSANASDPSRASADALTGSLISACRAHTEPAGHPGASTRIRFEAATANGPFAAIVSASDNAPSTAAPGSTTRLTKPTEQARSASTSSHVNASSLARC